MIGYGAEPSLQVEGCSTANMRSMRRLLVGLALLTLLWSPAAVASPRPNAPSASLSADADGGSASQASKLIFSTWQGEEFDNSFPPVKWPRAMHASGPEMTFTVHAPDLPQQFEIRQWRRLRANGIPRGKPHVTECFLADQRCGVTPAVSSAGLGWEAQIEAPWTGHVYIAVMGSWDHGQVAWINHVAVDR